MTDSAYLPDAAWGAPSPDAPSGAPWKEEFVVAPSAPSRRKPKWAVIAAALVVIVAGTAFVLRSSGSAEAVAFRYAFAEGEKQAYDITMSVTAKPIGVPDAQPFEGTMHAAMGYEVVDLEEDGSATLEMTIGGISFEPNVSTPPAENSTLRVRIAPDGRIASVKGTGGLFGAAGASLDSLASLPAGAPTESAGSQFMFPRFPADAVKPGDTWTESTSVPLPFGSGDIKMTSTGRHDGYEDSSAGRLARFHHAIEAPLDMSFNLAEMASRLGDQAGPIPNGAENASFTIGGKMSMDADSLVIPDTSELVRLDGTVNLSMTMKFAGASAELGGPTDLAFESTMRMSMVHVTSRPMS